MRTHPLTLPQQVQSLSTIDKHLLQPLEAILVDQQASLASRTRAAGILTQVAADRPLLLADWIVQVDDEQFFLLLDALEPHRDIALSKLREVVSERTSDDSTEMHRKEVRALIALLKLGEAEIVWSLLRSGPQPGIRVELIEAFARFNVDATQLLNRLETEREADVRAALLLALGEYPLEQIPSVSRDRSIAAVLSLFQTDDDGAVHAASSWLLKRWNQPVPNPQHGEPLPNTGVIPQGHRRWWTTSHGHTMVNLQGPVTFQMGSPASEVGRDPVEDRRIVEIKRSYALSQHEVTVEQFRRFNPDHPYAPDIAPDDECPVNKTSWIDAVRYCRWLSEQESVPESQMCYPSQDKISPDMEVSGDMLSRTGYRLPTEAEWEFAARGDSETPWFFGDSVEPLQKHAWYLLNSGERTWPVGLLRPNQFGLFDVYGNVYEWCHDASAGKVTAAIQDGLQREADLYPGEPYFRGSCYRSMTRLTRSAKRYSYPRTARVSSLGFRIARTLPDGQVDTAPE
jgi:formylglycine-generating enzyme required for sulfatase activity